MRGVSERSLARITVVRALLIVTAMKASTRVLAVAWVVLGVFAAACGGRSPIEPGDGSAGGHTGSGGRDGGLDTGTVCRGLDEATCTATPGCTAGTCGRCSATPAFEYCYRAGVDAPPVCVEPPCVPPPCDGLGETSCNGSIGCTAQYCHVCPNQQPTFAGCTAPGAPPVECPAEECVEVSCGSLDLATCKTRSDCQVYSCGNCGGQPFVGCGAQGGGVACPAIACVPPPPCSGLDQASCSARSDCQTESCPNCDGGVGFAGCIAPGEPQVQCPVACIGEPPCNQLSESQCTTRGDCAPGYCPNCGGGQRFVGCAAPGTAFNCPLACPAPAACSTVITEAACNARTDCHSVFVDPGTCDCTGSGCCAHFSRCADGAKASCTGTPLCQIVTPYCDPDAFVVSYTASCYEGCVRPTECGP